MTQIDGLAFTQLTNLNIVGELYEHGMPFGGVNAPLTLSTADDPGERPLTLVGGADDGSLNYDYVNSGLLFEDKNNGEIWRIWGSNPNDVMGPNEANFFAGYLAGFAQPTGTENASASSYCTGIGYSALENIVTASNNTALGAYALSVDASGGGNTAVGSRALEFTTGAHNTAIGYVALENATTGENNTAIGFEALRNVTTGISNIAIGTNAGSLIDTGDFNIIIGTSAQPPSASTSQWMNLGGEIQVDLAAGEIFFSNLPTSPGTTGSLYSDGGVVTVS